MAEKTYLLSDGSEEIVSPEDEQAFLEEIEKNSLTATIQNTELENQHNSEEESTPGTDPSQQNQQVIELDENKTLDNYLISNKVIPDVSSPEQLTEVFQNNDNIAPSKSKQINVDEFEFMSPEYFNAIALNKFTDNVLGNNTEGNYALNENKANWIFNSNFPSLRSRTTGGGLNNDQLLITMPDGLGIDGEIGSIRINLNPDNDYQKELEKLQWVWNRNRELKDSKGFIVGDIFGRRNKDEAGLQDDYSAGVLKDINTFINYAGYDIDYKSGIYSINKNDELLGKFENASAVQNFMYNSITDSDIKILQQTAVNFSNEYRNNVEQAYKERHGVDKDGNVDYSRISNEDTINDIFNSGDVTKFIEAYLEKDIPLRVEYDELIKYLAKPTLEEYEVREDQYSFVTKTREVENWRKTKYDSLYTKNEQGEIVLSDLAKSLVTTSQAQDSLKKVILEKVGWSDKDILAEKQQGANDWKAHMITQEFKNDPNYIAISFALDQKLKQGDAIDPITGKPTVTTLPLIKAEIQSRGSILSTKLKGFENNFNPLYEKLKQDLKANNIGVEFIGDDPMDWVGVLDVSGYSDQERRDALDLELNSEKYIKDGVDVIDSLEKNINSVSETLTDIQNQLDVIGERWDNGEYKTDGEIEEVRKQVDDLTLLYETIQSDNEENYSTYESLINDKNLLIEEYNKDNDVRKAEVQKEFQDRLNTLLKQQRDFLNFYNPAQHKLQNDLDKYTKNVSETNAIESEISKELNTMKLMQKDVQAGFANMIWGIGGAFGNEYSLDQLNRIQEGNEGLKRMLDYDTAVELGAKWEFAGRTMGQQFAPVAVAVFGGIIGIPPTVTAAIYGLQSTGQAKADLFNDVKKSKEAQKKLETLHKNKHLLSNEDFAKQKVALEQIIMLGDMDLKTINMASWSAGMFEFAFTRYFGTIPNANKAISQIIGKSGPTIGSLITRSNMKAGFQAVGSFAGSAVSEATEELGIYFSQEISQGLILGRDMDWSGWDDVLVATILTVGPMNGPSQVYSTITQQFATSSIKTEVSDIKSQLKDVQSKMVNLKPGDVDQRYRNQLKLQQTNLLKKLHVVQSGLEVDAMLAGGEGTKQMIEAAIDINQLYTEANIEIGNNDSDVDIAKKIDEYKTTLSDADALNFQGRLDAAYNIRNSVIANTESKISENIIEEGGVVEKLFGSKGIEVHNNLLEKNPDFNDLSGRDKLKYIHMHIQKNFVDAQIKEAESIPIFKQHVENIVYDGKFEDSGRKNRNKKQERKVYEGLVNRFNTRKVQATSIYRGQKQAAQQILDSNPQIKELSDLKLESELTVDQLKEKLNSDQFNLPKKEKDNIVKGLDDGGIKGIILDGTYMTTGTKEAVDIALQSGNVLQGTVFSHEIGHALDNLTMKEGELETYAENLSSHLMNNKVLKTVHDLVVDQLSNLTDQNGDILHDKNKGFKDQSTIGKDEYVKRVQDILQDPAFEPELKEAKKSAGKSAYNIIRGTKVGAKFLGGDFTLDTGKDAMSYLVEYIDSFKEGRLSELVTRKYKAKKDVGDTTTQQGSRKSADAGIVNRMGDFYKDDNKLWKEEGHQAVVNILQNKKLLDGLILDAQAKANPSVQIKNQSQEIKNNFIQDVYTEINSHIRNFNPEINDNLFAWINSQLGNKALNVQKRPEYSGDKLTRAKDLEARTEEGALIYQPASTDLSPEEIMIAKEDAQRNQIKEEILSERFGLDEDAEARFEEALVKAFGTKLPQVTDKKLRVELRKIVSDEVRPIVQGIMGTEQDFNAFIQNDLGPLLDFVKVDDLIQMERKVGGKTFPGGKKILAERKRITKVKEVIKLQDAGKIDPRIKPETGPSLKTRLKPTPQELMAYFRGFYIDNNGERQSAEKLLGYQPPGSMDTGILGARKDRIAELLVGEIAMDKAIKIARKVLPKILEIEGLQGREVRDNYIAEFGLTIDRDPTVVDKESSYKLSAEGVEAGTPSGAEFIIEADFLANEIEQNGYESVFDENGKLAEGYPVSSFTATFIKSLYDHGSIEEQAAVQFKQGVFKSKFVDQETKDEYKKVGNLRYNDTELERLNKNANTIASVLGKDVMNALPNEVLYELLGYKNRVMDPAAQKKDGSTGKFYESLRKIKSKVNKGKSKLVPGVILEDVNIMNIGATGSLFKDIAKILNKDITASEKKKQLAKLQPRIDAANVANIGLAKHIAKTIIDLARKGKISKVSALNILQSQTGIVNGFRGLSRLDLIQVLDGSQKVGENHPLFKDAVKYYKKKGFDNAEEKALQRLGYKGEHLAPNSNTMLKIAELIFNPSANIDYELDQAFQGHSQMLSSKYTTDVIDDKGGKNNTTDYHRVKFLDQKDISSVVSAGGRSYTEVLADREIDSIKSKLLKDSSDKSNKMKTTQKAVENSTVLKSEEPKGMSTFDFDETLIIDGENFVVATDPKTGKTLKIKSGDWPIQGPKLAAKGYDFNFDDFVNVRGGVKGPLFQKLLNRIKKYGPSNNFVLTARPQEAAVAIHGWLKSKGVDIPFENITGLANSTGEAKAQWMLERFAEGYNDMYFVDDALPNVEAVKSVIDQLDVKGSSVQAKVKFSKDADFTFNEILERATGIGREKQFSTAEARLRGKGKGKFDLFVPPSAEDFKGLLYRFLGTGKQGENDLKFFKENLLDPYAQGYKDWNAYKQNMSDDYTNLKKQNKKTVKDFNKLVPGTNFTVENAIRVYLWDSNGIEVPGLSQSAKRKLVNHVKGNAELTSFANTLSNITKINQGYVTPNDYWIAETIANDLSNAVNKVGRNQFLQQWIENSDIIFNENNLNKIEASYGPNFREALENILYRMKTGSNRLTGKDSQVNGMLDWVNGSVGAIMFFNIRSAALQTISTVNYFNFSDNNIFAASKAFANQPQYWKDFSYIFNSDMLKQRRSGLQIDVSASELTRVFKNGRGKTQAIIAFLLEKGFAPTRIADSFAIASGGATFYRNRLNKYVKEGMSEAEAKEQAWLDFQEITEETQQSSRPDLISQQQAGPLGRLILAFQNTPMQMTRLTKKALSDIVNRRGDMRSNIGKVMYYGVVQNLIFGALQSGLMFSLFGSNEEEEEKENQKKKSQRVLNGALDTLLRGTGIYGAAIATLKNTILKWQEERDKSFGRRDDSKIILEALNFSPPIGSKLRKINSAVKTERFNKGVSEQLGLRVENPNLNIAANVIEGLTNLPLARILNKVNNIEEAITSNHETWQRVALLSGWDKWSIGIKDEELEEAKVRAKQQRAEDKKKIKVKEKIEKEKAEEERKKKEGIKTVQCSGVRSNGERCSLTAETKADSWLCHHHKSYKPNEKTDSDGDGIKEVQCSATTSSGNRCRNRTENKNGKCYAHQ